MTDTISRHHDDTLVLPQPPPEQPAGEQPHRAPFEQSPPHEPADPVTEADRPERRGGFRVALVAALVAALVSAAVAVPLTLGLAGDDQPAEVAAPLPGGETGVTRARSDAVTTPVAAVAAQVSPSVAFVEVAGAQGAGAGSAIIYREDGYLLTNNHVVAGAEQVQVTLPDGTTEPAEVVGTDPSSDLAVLQVDAEGLPVPDFASRTPRVGETAIAIGSPFGLQGSVTSGIISALNRTVPVPDGPPLLDAIQTDAAINPGNSGGALVNVDGQVVGVNTAILSQTGANNGIGFAIPITAAIPIAEDLVEFGEVRYAQLGIQGQDVDPEIAELYGLGTQQGAVVVAVVPDSAADQAGLQRGDIITAVDGEPVESMSDLALRIRQFDPGAEATITYIRDGEEQEASVTLGAPA